MVPLVSLRVGHSDAVSVPEVVGAPGRALLRSGCLWPGARPCPSSPVCPGTRVNRRKGVMANQEGDQKVGHEAGLDGESTLGCPDLNMAGRIVLGVSMDAGDLYYSLRLPFGHLRPDHGHNAA